MAKGRLIRHTNVIPHEITLAKAALRLFETTVILKKDVSDVDALFSPRIFRFFKSLRLPWSIDVIA